MLREHSSLLSRDQPLLFDIFPSYLTSDIRYIYFNAFNYFINCYQYL